MTQYLFIFILPFLMTNFIKSSKPLDNLIYFTFTTYLILIVGLRFEMGLDWSNYIKEFYDRNYLYKSLNFFEIFFKNIISGNYIDNRNLEPLYLAFLKLSDFFSGNIILFNFLNAFLAIGCLSFFCFTQENKWFGLAISVGFIIFYGMDIIRQFTSLGFICLMIYNLSRNNFYYSIIYFLLSVSFHFSSIIFIPMLLYILFVENKVKLKSVFLILLFILSLIFFSFKFENTFINIYNNTYIGTEDVYINKGLIFRITLNLFSLFLFIFFIKKFNDSKYFKILKWYSFFIILLVVLYFMKINHTIIDRFVVFLLPYQILIYSHFLKKLTLMKVKNLYLFCVSFFYMVFAMNWLILSEDNFRVYVPYKSVIWEKYDESPSVVCNLFYKCRLEGSGDFIKYE